MRITRSLQIANGRTNGRMDGRMYGKTNRRTDGRRTDGRTDKRTDGQLNGRTDDKLDGFVYMFSIGCCANYTVHKSTNEVQETGAEVDIV